MRYPVRLVPLLLCLASLHTHANQGRSKQPPPLPGPATTTSRAKVSFTAEIRPILEQKCQPCHFPGGKMYAALPFDRPQTVVKLGTKLFTRIKDEQQRDLIRRFLAEQPVK